VAAASTSPTPAQAASTQAAPAAPAPSKKATERSSVPPAARLDRQRRWAGQPGLVAGAGRLRPALPLAVALVAVGLLVWLVSGLLG
jgi:hypothetical protein